MKKRILLLLSAAIILFVSATKQQLDFDKIWRKGYIAGWCYDEQPICVEPIPPIPPLPRIQDTTYEIIYNRGFIAGYKAKKQN